MNNNIKIKFKIISSYEINGEYIQEYRTYEVEEEYSKEKTFHDMLEDIYDKYSVEGYSTGEKYYVFDLNETIWGNNFSKKICSMMEYMINDYDDLTLEEMENQFDISKSVFHIWLDIYGIGDTVGEKEGITFFFHTNEKDIHIGKPHIHCKYSGEEIGINLETFEVTGKQFKKSKVKIALEVVKEHQEELLNYWKRKVINGESIKLKLDL